MILIESDYMISLTEFLLFVATFLICYVIIRAKNERKKDNRRYPPSMPSVPILGSLPFLIRGLKNMPEHFMNKSYELGPVFSLKMGSSSVLVLNNLEAIEDAFSSHGYSFAGKEPIYNEKHYANPNGKGIVFRNYSTEFAKYRRLSLSIMREFGFGSKSKSENFILEEVDRLIDEIKKKNGQAFDPVEIIMLSTSNVPLHMLLGQRRSFEEGLSEIFLLTKRMSSALNVILEVFPIFQYIPSFQKRIEDMIVWSARIKEILIAQTREIMQDETSDCFIRRYIEKEGPDYDHEQFIFTLRDLLMASIETTSTVMLWALICLANNPRVVERIQEEIDSVVPRDRLPSSDDQPLMPYTEATILEILRYRTPVPIGIPHLTLKNTKVLGYFIPANIMVFSNIRSAHMNHFDWSDPNVFKPERFLDGDNKLINKDKVIPFSQGRRSCPGEALARHQLFLFISGLVQNFVFLPPEGVEKIDDTEYIAAVASPSPFTIRMIERKR